MSNIIQEVTDTHGEVDDELAGLERVEIESFNRKEALLYGQFAKLSYQDEKQFLNALQHEKASLGAWEDTRLFETEEVKDPNGQSADTEIYVSFSKNYSKVVVAARGTSSLKDVGTDFTIRRDYIPDAFRPGGSERWEGAKVHRGFLNAVTTSLKGSNDEVSIAEAIVRYIVEKAANKLKTIFITGHSLGGAIANLFYLYFTKHIELNPKHFPDLSTIRVYTFGQPRVGNEEYCQQYNELLENAAIDVKYYRFVNNKDTVPQLPPSTLLYKYNDSPALCYWISEGENGKVTFTVIKNTPKKGKSLSDHSMDNYLAQLAIMEYVN